MENLKELLKNIDESKIKYDKEREKEKFSIITALHKERDEENLHSRFISYLLSSTSSHGMNSEYCKLFVREILNLEEDRFNLSNFNVFPNEIKKSEYKHIDILIVNKATSQAIVIENKIDAKDSNNDSKIEGYKGQLERYYNTIKRGIDKDGNPCPEYQCKSVYVYYLSNNKQPSEESIGMLKNEPNSWKNENVISYEYHIREWLKKCIENTPKEKLIVKEFIHHYLKVINKMTHNDIPIEERIKLKDIVATEIESSKYLIENFKHVKWHTVDDFINELEVALKDIRAEIIEKPNAKSITSVTHNNSKEEELIIKFKFNNSVLQIVNDAKGFTLGNLTTGKWGYFSDEIDEIKDIRFCDFSQEKTFRIINCKERSILIEKIIEEIVSEKYNTLKNNF